MIDAARSYRQRGLGTIPVGADKRPMVDWKAFQDELPHPDQIDEWWARWPEANIGVVTGRVSGVVVLDADGPEGLDSLKALNTPATTWLSRTGRGHHQWFQHPGVTIGNRAGVRPHLDVRGDGGYVVAPPSLHASGRRYEWLTSPDDLPLARVPADVLALLTTPSGSSPAAAPSGDTIPEGQRNDQLYRLARSLMRRGLAEGAVHVAIAQHNRERCRPPMPDREVRELVEHALLQPHRPDFDPAAPVTGSTAEPVNDAPIIPLGVGLGRFLATTFRPVEVYIEGVLASDGGGFAGGEEKLGKSLYCEHEGLCLATGRPVCGRFAVPQRRRVLFVQEEDSPRRTHARLHALLRGLGLDPEDLDVQADLDAWFSIEVWAGFSFDNPAMVARLDAALATFRPAVCYLDVLRKMTAADLNKAAEAGPVLTVLDTLRRRHGTVFRLVHHYRKLQGGFRAGRGSQEISGSFVLGAWAEQSLFFEPTSRKPGAPVVVTVQSKDAAPVPGFTLRIESEGPAHTPTLYRLVAEDQKTADDADERVYQAVASLPALPALAGRPGVPIADIVTAVKRSDKTVRRSLGRLMDAERVLVTGQVSRRRDLYGVRE